MAPIPGWGARPEGDARRAEAHQGPVWSTAGAGTLGGRPQAETLCWQLKQQWEALWTFALVEGVEPTNNAAERALRPGVLWRKGSFGSQSQRGSRFAEVMMSVAASCRQQKRNLLGFLMAACRATLSDSPIPSLVPQSPTQG